MGISASDVQSLRERTGAGIMAVKKALEETGGNVDKAIDVLRKKGEAKAAQRAGRETHEGVIASYIHSNHKLIGVVVLHCETDFVARTDDFQNLANAIAMHIAASNPHYISMDDVPEDERARETEIVIEQLANEGVPEKAREKALLGKLNKHFAEMCLLEQQFIKDPDTTVGKMITAVATKTGENIKVAHIARFSI